jgi:hypothetical protein
MKNILYVIAVLFLLMWAIGSFAYHVGSALIHLLLVVGIIAIVINIFNSNKRRY